MTNAPRLMMVINEDRFFFSHRRDIAVAAQEMGLDVTLVCKDTGRRRDVEKLGIHFIGLPVNPTGRDPREELRTLLFLYRLYRRKRPDIVHHVGMKNMLWGSLAARVAGVPGVLNAVSGLGTLFADTTPPLLTRAIIPALRAGMNRDGVAVIFQNHEDEQLFLAHRLTSRCRTVFIKGSGVDLRQMLPAPLPQEKPMVVLFCARMLRSKGVEDLAAAARILRPEYEGKAEFWLCGRETDNPGSLSAAEINALCDGRYIRWLGHRDDIPDLLRRASVVALPSYYREGLPKALIEASAIGRPIVTCDSVGCRDAVEEGLNGFKVEPRNPELLADRLGRLLSDPDLRAEMGRHSRRIAERDYDIRSVVERHQEAYLALLGGRYHITENRHKS